MNNRKPDLFPFARRPLLFGHRGCSGAAPENTIPAFQKILDNGIPGVELDVQLCRTGELVVLHDSSLKRTTGLDQDVVETDFTTVRALDAGSWFGPEFSGEKIPLLDEVIDLLGNSVYYDIEIKDQNRRDGELERAVVDTIHRRGLAENTLVSSFSPFSIRTVRRQDPAIQTGYIYTKYPGFPWYFNRGAGHLLCSPDIIKPNRHRLSRWTVLWKKNVLGFPLVTWTEDDPEVAEAYLNLGLDGLISNVPERMLPFITPRWSSAEHTQPYRLDE
jgi:glycerophosphoryl diester phosphodiesterase